MIFWYIVNLNMRRGKPGKLLIAYLFNFLVGPCLYLIVPARGPRHAFGAAFPALNPDVAPVLVRLSGWPNAMPSLHVSTALLLVLFAGRNRVLRCVGWAYLAGTVAATLAFEHYLIDLIVAVPFACFAALSSLGKIRQALGNLAIVLGWLLAIRLATPALITYPSVLRLVLFATIGFAGFSMMSSRKWRYDVLPQTASTELQCATSRYTDETVNTP
jgi:PAP2 superfamily